MNNLSNTDNPSKIDKLLSYAPWLAGGFALFLLVLYSSVFLALPWNQKPESWGQFGDYVGGLLNPTIAFFTLMVAVQVWKLQRTQLSETKLALDEQMHLQRYQAARTSFFNLLTLRSEAVNSVQWNADGVTLSGRIAISKILENLANVANNNRTNDFQEDLDKWKVPQNCTINTRPHIALFAAFYSNEGVSSAASWNLAALAGDQMQLKNLEAQLGHIFRATYQVLKFAYECPNLDTDERKDFSNYLKAQMSEGEFVLFALTALTSIGEKSRAISIAFDFYEKRLYSIAWARDLRIFFNPKTQENLELAKSHGYQVLNHAD